MRRYQVIILVVVGFSLFLGVSLLGWRLFFPHQHLGFPHFSGKFFSSHSPSKPVAQQGKVMTQEEQQALNEAKALEAALTLQEKGEGEAAEKALEAYLKRYPHSVHTKEGLQALGKIREARFFTVTGEVVDPHRETYTVVSGDSLARIAQRHHLSPELLQRFNQMPDTRLRVGQDLLIPSVETKLTVDLEEGVLLLFNGNQLLQAYSFLSTPFKKSPSQAREGRVIDKVASVKGKRVPFGHPLYAQSHRVIIIPGVGNIVGFSPQEESQKDLVDKKGFGKESGATNSIPVTHVAKDSQQEVVTSSTSAATGSPTPAMPTGFVLSEEDLHDLYPFVTQGVVVTILPLEGEYQVGSSGENTEKFAEKSIEKPVGKESLQK